MLSRLWSRPALATNRGYQAAAIGTGLSAHEAVAARRTATTSQRRTAVPPRGVKSGTKRARQYEHIKDGLIDRGSSTDEAEEIAARTVNKERARHGESKTASRTSTEDISSGRRGGLRSGTRRARGRTRDQLYEEARELKIRGRSSMTKAQLLQAVNARSTTARVPAG
jgi:hypothetical protein